MNRLILMLKDFIRKNVSTSKTDNDIQSDNESSVAIDKSVIIENCKITLTNSKLIVNKGARISGFEVYLSNAVVTIGEDTILLKANSSLGRNYIGISNGTLTIGHHSRVCSKEISVRFGGNLKIGSYTAINDGCDLRCDESLVIGDFNMISYECVIYDTNSHCIYPAEYRRKMTVADFPNIGSEIEKPVTKPVVIGNDCWIGKRAIILKGVVVGDSAIVGIGSVVTDSVGAMSISAGNPARCIKEVTEHKHK